jgi:hypothetical protein
MPINKKSGDYNNSIAGAAASLIWMRRRDYQSKDGDDKNKRKFPSSFRWTNRLIIIIFFAFDDSGRMPGP